MDHIAHLKNSSNQETNLCKALILSKHLLTVTKNNYPLFKNKMVVYMLYQYIFIILLFHLLLEKDRAFHLNKLESTLTQNVLCQVWFQLTQWFWRRFLNFVNVFLLFLHHLPLDRDAERLI